MDAPSYGTKSKNNGMAITSLVTGIVGWVFFITILCLNFAILPMFAVATLGIGALLYICMIPLGCLSPIVWIVSVVTGHMAKNQIRQTGDGGSGMATAGLIMGYVGLGLTVISFCAVVILSLTGASIPFIDQLLSEMGVY